MNLDGINGYQCVDVPNDYAEWLFGDWQQTIGRGDAKDKYAIAPLAYWGKIANDPHNPNLMPERGDVIVWPAMTKIDNPAGHIAVVLSATTTNVTVIEQDGFDNTRPAAIKTHPYLLQGVLPIGWLRPRPEKMIADQGAASDMEPHQIVKDLYQAFTGQIPSDDILNQKADYIAGNNSVQQVAKDVASAGGWKADPDWNHAALVSYRDTFAIPGENVDQWASERQQGGETFDSQVHQELPPILVQSNKAASLQTQLSAAQAQIDDLTRQNKSLTSQNNIAQDTIKHLSDKLDAAQQAQPAVQPVDAHPDAPAPVGAPTAPQVVVPGPVATKPGIKPAPRPFWKQILSLFINF